MKGTPAKSVSLYCLLYNIPFNGNKGYIDADSTRLKGYSAVEHSHYSITYCKLQAYRSVSRFVY